MQQALRFALILFLAMPGAAPGAQEADGLTKARSLIARGDDAQAVELLVELLPQAAGRDRGVVLDLLRQSYRSLIARAEAAGRKAEADAYRDDLAIVDPGGGDRPKAPAPPARSQPPAAPAAEPPRPDSPAPAPAPAPPAPSAPEMLPLPRTEAPAEAAPVPEPAALPDPGPAPPLAGPEVSPAGPPSFGAAGEPSPARPPRDDREPGPESPTAAPSDPALAAPSPAPLAGAPRPKSQPETASSASDLARADQLFNAKHYDEAGRIYARLAAANQLPAGRRQVWAYCRWVAVVARINAPPQDDREWDAIEQEVRSIQRLTPGNWYGEYLRNRVAEARRGGKAAGRPGRLVVRGSEPDETPPRRIPRFLSRNREPSPSLPPPAAAASPSQPLSLPSPEADEPPSPASPASEAIGRDSREAPAPPSAASTPSPPAPLPWQVRESANFRIFHMDPLLAEKAAAAAEAVRSKQARRWGSTATRSTWNPRCEIYLYPTPRDFAEMTGQPETSPGFSTLGLNASQITARRVNLRADHPQLLSAILPHEVTHVVLADLFTDQQIPRWADEGMAVLSEPLTEQLNRSADLVGPLADGRVFKLSELMAIDYPNAEAWNLYYAQSVSLTQFLVEQATPEQFIRFVRAAQREGVEAALRDLYRINGFADLESRWLKYARRQVSELASSRESPRAGDSIQRQ